MSEATYAERLALYVEQLPEPLKDALLVKVTVCLFGAQNGSGPERLTAFGAALKLLADFAPELHEHHDRRALTDALGDYMVEWLHAPAELDRRFRSNWTADSGAIGPLIPVELDRAHL